MPHDLASRASSSSRRSTTGASLALSYSRRTLTDGWALLAGEVRITRPGRLVSASSGVRKLSVVPATASINSKASMISTLWPRLSLTVRSHDFTRAAAG